MERPLKNDAPRALAPAADGWQILAPGEVSPSVMSLEQAVATLHPEASWALQLPANAVVLERMTLPSTDPAELLGMARLQLEKTLPFTEEEVSSDISIIHRGEAETTLLAVAVHHPHLQELCAPMLAQQRWPEAITVRALELARNCPMDATVLLVTRELGTVVLAMVESAKLSFAQAVDAPDAATLLAELPQVLMGAEMEGVPGDFTRIVVTRESANFSEALADFFRLPVEELSLGTTGESTVNLLPEPWKAERGKLGSRARVKRNLGLAGIAYLLLIVAAFAYLVFLDMRTRALLQKVAVAEPQVQLLVQQQSRWRALSPAVDPKFYTVELLNQIAQCLPSEELRITQFTTTPAQVSVEAEAPSVNAAIDFGERLKASPALKPFRFNASAPTILANNRAQVRIFGKL